MKSYTGAYNTSLIRKLLSINVSGNYDYCFSCVRVLLDMKDAVLQKSFNVFVSEHCEQKSAFTLKKIIFLI